MPFTVPPLPYGFDALEPHIDAKTMEIHHGKHHAAYVTNLNKALESAPNLGSKTVEELLANNCAIVPENIRTAVLMASGATAQLLASSSSRLAEANPGADSSALFRLVM